MPSGYCFSAVFEIGCTAILIASISFCSTGSFEISQESIENQPSILGSKTDLANARNDAVSFKAALFIRAAFQNRWGREDILWR